MGAAKSRQRRSRQDGFRGSCREVYRLGPELQVTPWCGDALDQGSSQDFLGWGNTFGACSCGRRVGFQRSSRRSRFRAPTNRRWSRDHFQWASQVPSIQLYHRMNWRARPVAQIWPDQSQQLEDNLYTKTHDVEQKTVTTSKFYLGSSWYIKLTIFSNKHIFWL